MNSEEQADRHARVRLGIIMLRRVGAGEEDRDDLTADYIKPLAIDLNGMAQPAEDELEKADERSIDVWQRLHNMALAVEAIGLSLRQHLDGDRDDLEWFVNGGR